LIEEDAGAGMFAYQNRPCYLFWTKLFEKGRGGFLNITSSMCGYAANFSIGAVFFALVFFLRYISLRSLFIISA